MVKYFILTIALLISIPSNAQQISDSMKAINNKLSDLKKRQKVIEQKIDSLEKINQSVGTKIDSLNILKLHIQQERNKSDKDELLATVKISSFGGSLRTKPTTESAVILELGKGDQVKVYEEFKDPYFKVNYDGKVGYISYASFQDNYTIERYINKIERRKLKEKDPYLARLIEEFGRKNAKRINNDEIWIGMTEEMLLESRETIRH